ncbi:carbohydrate ABC transporter permease [Streptomyces sp. NPDC005303]|uniref:carbohydrate ABC transporter permease n=1 Tax=Streptomyces sp. NPDC005303 TaxID=3155713 RepID=UPI0033B37F9D
MTTPTSSYRYRPRTRWSDLAFYAGIAGIIVYCVAPFYWMVVSSLRRTSDIFDLTPLPRPWSMENYRAVLGADSTFLRALLNSVIVAGVTTAVALVIAISTSYALARLRFRFKRVLLTLVIATSMFPQIALVVPLLKLFTDIGWINTYQSMILPSLSFALPLAVWTLTTFFKQMPTELEQAAMVDGCTKGQAFFRVVLPVAAPGVFTTAIITFVSAWNEFLIALSMTDSPDYETAPVAISKFSGVSQFVAPFGSQMAAGVLVTVPLIVVVLIFQRRIVAGLASGSVK